MGELGHANTAIRAREQGVDCFIDENRELGMKVSELYSQLCYCVVMRRKNI